MRASRPKFTSVVIACATLFLLAACGGGKSAAPTPPVATATTAAQLSPGDILARASQKLAATNTVAFNLNVAGETFVDQNKTIQLLNAKGNLVRPDQVSTEFRIKVLKTATLSMQLVIAGRKHWSTDLITGKWGPAPEEFGYDPSILFDRENGIGPVMDRITGATMLANESVQGRATYHIQAVAGQNVIGLLTSETMTGEVNVELWIDTQNFNLLQAKLSESPALTDHHPAQWTLSLTKQDEKMTIMPPDAPYSLSSPVASPAASPAGSPIASPASSPVSSPGAGD